MYVFGKFLSSKPLLQMIQLIHPRWNQFLIFQQNEVHIFQFLPIDFPRFYDAIVVIKNFIEEFHQFLVPSIPLVCGDTFLFI